MQTELIDYLGYGNGKIAKNFNLTMYDNFLCKTSKKNKYGFELFQNAGSKSNQENQIRNCNSDEKTYLSMF